ncbi:S1 family peptidase [Bauldia sp.]|uniref:S1 family peptidase n=1 Tax=Bauldia sp. TaxID=2575872 RepID=UPI003BACC1A1
MKTNRYSGLGVATLTAAVFAVLPASAEISTEFVVGGSPAAEGAWPWQVRLLDTRDPNSGFCGGSLIDPQWVLTAAHCLVVGDGIVERVVVGHGSIYQSKLKMVDGAMIIVHPDYLTDNHADLALIKLAEPITGAATIGIADPTAESALISPGTKLTVTGWGALWDFEGFEEALYSRSGRPEVNTRALLSANALMSPEQLHEVEVEVIDTEECRAAYEAYGQATGAGFSIARTEICAGSPSGAKDSCYGDSGGPLVVRADTPQGYLQVGVVSWGSQCGNPVLPGVYNRISRFTDWVGAQMANN